MFFKVMFVGFSPIHFSIRIASPAFYQLSKSRAQNGAAEPTFGSPKRSTKLREGKKNRFTPQKFNLFPLKMDGWKTILWKFHGNFTLFFWNLGTLRKAKLGVWNIVPACYSETFNVEKSEPQNSPNKKTSIDLSTGCGSQRLPTIGWWYPFHGPFQVPPTIQPKITTTTWL